MNYAFDLDGQGYSGGFGVGRVKNVSSDLHLNEKLIPIIKNHRDGEVSLELFAGDTDKYKWSRHYKIVSNVKIYIDPELFLSKKVSIMPPNPPPGKFTAIYSDGRSEEIEGDYPDYERLLSMK
ncbi:hypothetical protein [Erwinia billingiae]|uniref:hypothetical protein n=1 Tax=Erwinia billingiae TaxID=182337 RepID=UPI001245EDFC|nr:hypothetical protein [Erwinia billingiae]